MIMHHTKNSLPENKRKELVEILNKTLATLSDLYSQIKNAHWNVKGMQFYSLHLLFDEIAEEVEEQVDIIAERITALGGTALGTIQEAVKNTELNPYPTNIYDGKEHIERLSHNFSIVSELSRNNLKKTEELNDMATNDIYIDLTRLLEKRLWFLEAHIQSKKN